jgi:citrate lyase subunit beta/citryl-CoA lyase
MPRHPGWMLPLFVPGTRPERFARAASCGVDAIIIDLEDSVAPEDKDLARSNARAAEGLGIDLILRVNASGSPWHEADLAVACAGHVTAVMLPKTSGGADAAMAVAATGGKPVVALIETAGALTALDSIAGTAGVAQLAFGTQDLALELGCSPRSRLLDGIRLRLLLASLNAGIAPPLDGVSLDIGDEDALTREAQDIVEIGFAGRLLIHPGQVRPSIRGLTPSDADLAHARRVADSSGAAVRVDGRMVDRPVRLHADRLLERARRARSREICA